MTLTQKLPVRQMRGRPAWAFLGLAAALFTAPAASVRAQTISEVQVTPETMTLGVNQRQALFAAAYDRQGNLVPSAKFTFWSSDTLIVRVMRDGTVVGVAPGLAKVEARVQSRRASMAVLITGGRTDSVPVPPGSVLTLAPAAITMLPGESVSVTAQAVLQDGSPISPGRITWKVLAPEIASVDSAGVVTGVGPGRTVVQATGSGLMATVPVWVEPADFALSRPQTTLGPEEMDTLRTIVPSQGNREVRSGIRWYSSDTAVVRVAPNGIITGRGPGRATVTAAGFAQERRAEVMVHRVPQVLVVSPPAGPVVVPVNGTREVTAVAEAADSTPIPEARLDWSVGDTSLVAFDASRRTLTGKAAGRTTLTVRLRGFDPVVWTVEVIPGLVGLDRSRLGLTVGERGTLRANLLDEGGKVVGPASGLEWSSNRPEVARVSGNGTIDGLSLGRSVVTARSPWGRSDSAVVLVTSDLVVASNRSGTFGIYQLRASAGDTLVPVLVDSASNLQASFSPDRTRIAFSSDRNGTYDLFVMDADGRHLQQLTADPGGEGEPLWTPDGTRIVYTASPRGGLPQLASIGSDGRDQRTLTTTAGGNHSPDLSPDGRSIAFISARDGNQEVYVMVTGGGEARRLTKTGARESSPHFLPGGQLVYIMEAGGRSKGSRVMRISQGGTDPAAMFETEQPVLSLDVSRDGTRVAYVVGRLTDASRGKGQFSFFIQTLAGGTPEPIPLRPGEQVVSPSF